MIGWAAASGDHSRTPGPASPKPAPNCGSVPRPADAGRADAVDRASTRPGFAGVPAEGTAERAAGVPSLGGPASGRRPRARAEGIRPRVSCAEGGRVGHARPALVRWSGRDHVRRRVYSTCSGLDQLMSTEPVRSDAGSVTSVTSAVRAGGAGRRVPQLGEVLTLSRGAAVRAAMALGCLSGHRNRSGSSSRKPSSAPWGPRKPAATCANTTIAAPRDGRRTSSDAARRGRVRPS